MPRPCSKCGGPRDLPAQRYCRRCRREYRLARRRRGLEVYATLSAEGRRRAKARAKAGVYLRRGQLQRGPCVDCGGPGEEMHHEDYSRPLDVTWLCLRHHRSRTAAERKS